MRKFAALTAVVCVLAMPSARASTRLVATPKCDEPVPTRRYDGRSMTYGTSIDLTGCWWWDGSPIQLEATLSRLDGTGEESSTTVVLCGGRVLGEDRASGEDEAVDDDAAEDAPDDTGPRGDASQGRAERDPDEGDDVDDDAYEDGRAGGKVAAASDDTRSRRSTCEVATGLDHPPAELARYRGEVTYPWRDGPRTVSFTAYCASPGSVCRDG